MRLIILALCLVILSSCDSKRLGFLDSLFTFFVDNELGYFRATGTWEFDDKALSKIPHSVEIICNKEPKLCRKTVTYIDNSKIDNKFYFIINSQTEFNIIKWNHHQIIAKFYHKDLDTEACKESALFINLTDRTVNIVSNWIVDGKPVDTGKFPKIGGYVENATLRDRPGIGAKQLIHVGSTKLEWNNE